MNLQVADHKITQNSFRVREEEDESRDRAVTNFRTSPGSNSGKITEIQKRQNSGQILGHHSGQITRSANLTKFVINPGTKFGPNHGLPAVTEFEINAAQHPTATVSDGNVMDVDVLTTVSYRKVTKSSEPLNSGWASGTPLAHSSASSWASRLRAPPSQSQSGKLSFIPPAIVNGKKEIHLSSIDFVDKIRACEKWLVVSFVGKRLSYVYVKSVLTKLWKPKGEFDMISRGDSMLIFKFALDEDRQRALNLDPPTLLESLGSLSLNKNSLLSKMYLFGSTCSIFLTNFGLKKG